MTDRTAVTALVSRLPYPLAYSLSRLLVDAAVREPGRPALLFPYCICALNSLLVRIAAVVGIQSYVPRASVTGDARTDEARDAEINAEIIKALREPADGTWQRIADLTLKAAAGHSEARLADRFRNALDRKLSKKRKDKTLGTGTIRDGLKDLIWFRNRLIHGAPIARKDMDKLDWQQSLAPEFMAWFCLHIASLLPDVDLNGLWSRVPRTEEFVESLAVRVRHARTAGVPLPKQFLARTVATIRQRAREEELGALTSLFCALGRLTSAVRQARAISSPGVRAHALARIAASRPGVGRARSTACLLIAARRAAEAVENPWHRAGCLAQAGRIADELGLNAIADELYDAAVTAAASAPDPAYRSSALGRIAELLALAGHQRRARDLFADAQRLVAAATVTPERHQVRLGGHAWRLANAGLIDEAMACANEMASDGNRRTALRRIAEALALAGQTDRARAVVNSMEPGSAQTEAWAAVATALARTGKVDEAESALQHVDLCAAVRKAWTVLAACLAQQGLGARARDMFQRTVQCGAVRAAADKQDILLVALVPGLARAGGLPQALPALARIEADSHLRDALTEAAAMLGDTADLVRLLECANRLRSGTLQQQAWSAIAQALARGGAVDVLLNMADTVQHHESKSALVGTVCRGLVVAGGNAQVLDRLWDIASAIDEPGTRALAFADIGAAWVRLGEPAHAQGAFAGADDEARKLADAHRRRLVFPTLVGLFVHAGEEPRARALAESVGDQAMREDCRRAIAAGLAARGQIAAARVIAASLAAHDQRALAFMAIAAADARSARPQECREHIAEALSAASEITTLPVRDRTHAQLAVVLAHMGDIDGAFSASERIMASSTNNDALNDILDIAAARNDFGALRRLGNRQTLGQECWERLLPNWRRHLSRTDRAGDLRRSLTLCPLSEALAYDGIGRILGYHLGRGDSRQTRQIIGLCPECQLDFLPAQCRGNEAAVAVGTARRADSVD